MANPQSVPGWLSDSIKGFDSVYSGVLGAAESMVAAVPSGIEAKVFVNTPTTTGC